MSGEIANVDTAAQLANLIGLISGKTQSQTTSSNVSKQGMDALMQQILSGPQGLASIANGQRSAGLYNSSTNQLLTNDFVTRSAGELAARQAGTTTVTKTPATLSSKLQTALLLKSLYPKVKGLFDGAGGVESALATPGNIGLSAAQQAAFGESAGLGVSTDAATSLGFLSDALGTGAAVSAGTGAAELATAGEAGSLGFLDTALASGGTAAAATIAAEGAGLTTFIADALPWLFL